MSTKNDKRIRQQVRREIGNEHKAMLRGLFEWINQQPLRSRIVTAWKVLIGRLEVK